MVTSVSVFMASLWFRLISSLIERARRNGLHLAYDNGSSAEEARPVVCLHGSPSRSAERKSEVFASDFN